MLKFINMSDYSSLKTAAEKFAALKEMAGKKPVPRLNPNVYYHFSNKFLHFLDTNKYYTTDLYITNLLGKNGRLVSNEFIGTMIDIGSESDTISYIEIDKLIKIFLEEKSFSEKTNNNFMNWFNKIALNDPEIWKQSRTEMKAGRFIKRMFNFNDKSCEEFANLYKSYNDSFN